MSPSDYIITHSISRYCLSTYSFVAYFKGIKNFFLIKLENKSENSNEKTAKTGLNRIASGSSSGLSNKFTFA